MVGADGSAGSGLPVERIRRRFAYATAAANIAGALVVFGFLEFVLPEPVIPHGDRALVVNGAVFALVLLATTRIGWVWSRRRWYAALTWAGSARTPDERERLLVLRFPLTQAEANGVLWVGVAVLFAALNAPFSWEIAGNVAIGIILGGLVTCALGYLLAERLLRPLTARCLSSGSPPPPQLPGVAAHALLAWTLGTGVVLLGIALIGLGGLRRSHFSEQRVAIAVLVLSCIGIGVGLVATVGLARSLADRIRALLQAVGLVEQGRLDHEVAVDDGSEVGLLQAGFNQMVAGLRERERIRDLFGRQVGEDVARQALDRGVELGGEARDAAVMFVDIQGSTSLAESRDPTEVVSILNDFFAIVVEVVASHDGWINKFEGDAALCVFGAPLTDPDAASHALAAARELGERLECELEEITAGIGVSAGRIVAGNIGAARRFEYTVIGDPVNEAARLTELAKSAPARVLVSDAALSRAGEEEAARWRRREQITLRGRSAATGVAAPLP